MNPKSILTTLLTFSLLLTGAFGGAAPAQAQAEPDTMTASEIATANPDWAVVEFDVPIFPPYTANVGLWPSIAINPLSHSPYVVFRNETHKRLHLVYHRLDQNGNCGPAYTWQCDVLTYDDGEMSSIDFAANGNWAVSYNLASYPMQKIIKRYGNTSTTEVIMDGGVNGCYANEIRFSSLKMENGGTPRVVFSRHGKSNLPASLNEVNYAYPNSGSGCWDWGIDDVDIGYVDGTQTPTYNGYYPSLDIEASTNGPRIAFRGVWSVGSPHSLIYAAYTGAGGDHCMGSDTAPSGWSCSVIDPTDGIHWISLHAPQCSNCGDGTRIAYYNSTYGQVRLARYTGSNNNYCSYGVQTGDLGWACSAIDSVGVGSGMGVSMAHHNGNPVIAYYDYNDTSHGILKIARYVGGGGNCGSGVELNKWACEVVDDGGSYGYDVGQHAAVARDPNGRIFIAYYNATTGALRVAYERSPAPDFQKSYHPDTVGVGQVSEVWWWLHNGAAIDNLTGLSFADYLINQTIVPGSVTNGCGGSVSASGNGLSLNGGALYKGGSCFIKAQVTGDAVGAWYDVTSSLTSNEALTAPYDGAWLWVNNVVKVYLPIVIR